MRFDEPVGPERLRAHKIWVRDLALNAVALHPAGAAHRAYPLGVFGLPVAPKRVRSKSEGALEIPVAKVVGRAVRATSVICGGAGGAGGGVSLVLTLNPAPCG